METASQVIVFASQKGGSGKSTLSGHIAVQAGLCGAGPVGLIDTDRQASLAGWASARADDAPLFQKSSVEDLDGHIFEMRNRGVKLIVIDTPPAATTAIGNVVRFADLVVIPTRPSPHDLRAVGATVDLVEQRRKAMIFVVNAATRRARITSDAAVALSQHGTVAPVTLHHRIDYAASMIDGRTVMEVNASSQSSKEIADLWTYIDERLRKLAQAQQQSAEMPRVGLSANGQEGSLLRRQAPGAFGRRVIG